MSTALSEYLSSRGVDQVDTSAVAFIASLQQVATVTPNVAASIVAELRAQRETLKLIASENYSSLASQLACGNLLTDKYAEGYPGHRFYAGCQNIDDIESYASQKACDLFGCDYAYVQPHSGADANLVAFSAILRAKVETPYLQEIGQENVKALTPEQWTELRRRWLGQRMLALDLGSGGHLTHGDRTNLSSKIFAAEHFHVDKATGLINMEEVRAHAHRWKPLVLLIGYSAYPRKINFREMREIADSVGAVLMVDMAHFAGLVAGKVFTSDFNPVPHAHLVTTTTHKTLRGPRGGLVLCTEQFAPFVKAGCPMVLGGPLPHVMAAKAVAFTEADTSDFRDYSRRVVDNAQNLAAAAVKLGLSVVTGGTDNHIVLIDVTGFGLTGRQAESAMRDAGITLNRNSLPHDKNGAWYTSGLRIGTPAITTLGMRGDEMREIADILRTVLVATKAEMVTAKDGTRKLSQAKYTLEAKTQAEVKARVRRLLERFPVYPNLDLGLLERHFGTPTRETGGSTLSVGRPVATR